jgi:transposase-like protein
LSKPKSRTVSKTEVSQKINLREKLGQFSQVPAIREAFLQAVIDKIVERTQSSRDVNGKVFDAYSKSYKESLAFKVFGKSNKVDMTLTGDMLGSIDKLDETRDTATIAITGDDNILKAFAHITSFEGHKYLDGKVPKRDFFGVTEKEIDSIVSNFTPDQSPEATANDAAIVSKLLNVLGG